MYRQREMETQDGKFVKRLYDLPMVHSAVGKVSSIYNGTKEHNRVFKFLLQSAETSVGLMVHTAKPVVDKFERPIGTLNNMACQQLIKLEHDYPIIKEPTDVVFKQTMDTCTTAVKPLTDRVGSAKDYSVAKVNGAKEFAVGTIGGVANYGADKVNGVRSYGAEKLAVVGGASSRQLNRLLQNHLAASLVSSLDQIVRCADTCIDTYLPEEEKENSSESDLARPGSTKGLLSSDDNDDQMLLMTRALMVTSKLRRRAYVRIIRRMKILKARSLETIEKLNVNVNLIEYARTGAADAYGKMGHYWEEINKSPDEVGKEKTMSGNGETFDNVTYEQRAIATARHLTWKLKAGFSSLNLSMDLLPLPLRAQINNAVDLLQSLYSTFTMKMKTGFSSKDLDSVKMSVSNLNSVVRSWTPSSAAAAMNNAPVIGKVLQSAGLIDANNKEDKQSLNSSTDSMETRESTEEDSEY